MFAKLLKHEWNWAWRQLGLVSLGALGAGVLGAVLLKFLTSSLMDESSDLLGSILGILLGFLILALAAYVLGSGFVLLYRYYKNKFTDEGYLTFTLPVKSWQIFLSSLVNTIAWSAIVSLVAFTAVGLIVLVGLGDTIREMISEMRYYYGNDLLGALVGEADWAATVMYVVNILVSFVAGETIALSCITMGCTFAKKHKILASIGIYYGLSMLKSIISTVVTVLVTLQSSDASLVAVYIVEDLLQVALALGGYLLSIHLLNKELNLP